MAHIVIPGKPADSLVKTQNSLIRTTLTLYGVVLFGFAISAQNYGFVGKVIIYIFVFAGAGCGFAAIVVSVMASYRASSEVSFGYTTLSHRNLHVEQVDPLSGRTIRGAGEPFLTRQIQMERISSDFDLSADGHEPLIPRNANTQRSRWQYVAIVISALGALFVLLVRLGLL